MAAPQGSLILIVYAPALVGGDGRPATVVHGMERALPGLRLEWTISDEGRFIPLAQRDVWIAEEKRDGGFPLLCNGDENNLVTIYGVKMLASEAPGGQAQFEVHAEWPLEAAGIVEAADVLEEVAEGSRALWGHATPGSAALDIALQTSPTLEGPPCPPRGLPALKLSWDLRAPEIPHRLGWLNYWSAAAAQAIGFPDPSRDADLLSRARRTATGGWVVRLTDTPLALDNPAHLDALKRAYGRFPEIGGRTVL
ncbi:MAG: DUF5953 family protein [Hyalangium sp.]|uniref:DUF5953 family protein n=1 Tax=Hyalangium sp. TaxID=2028555 RepID=UPI00389A7FF6